MTKAIDQGELVAELAGTWLDGLTGADRTEGRSLLKKLVADWAREADSDSDPEAVNKIQKSDLTEAGRGLGPKERLATLRLQLLGRQIKRLRVRTYALGTSILDGKTTAAAGKKKGAPLLKEAEELLARLRELPDTADSQRLHRDLTEAQMEALFAVEGKAMSLRLNRYKGDQSPGKIKPPDVR